MSSSGLNSHYHTAPADARRAHRRAVKPAALLSVLAAVFLTPPAARAGEPSPWTFQASLYGLAVGMGITFRF